MIRNDVCNCPVKFLSILKYEMLSTSVLPLWSVLLLLPLLKVVNVRAARHAPPAVRRSKEQTLVILNLEMGVPFIEWTLNASPFILYIGV